MHNHIGYEVQFNGKLQRLRGRSAYGSTPYWQLRNLWKLTMMSGFTHSKLINRGSTCWNILRSGPSMCTVYTLCFIS